MPIEASAAFTLGDLAVFDDTRLRQLIGGMSGAVPPALVGLAFAGDGLEPSLVALAERIERALPPESRASFAQARAEAVSAGEREMASRVALDRLFWDLTYWKTPEEYDRLTAGEQVHLGALDIARVDGAIVLDAGAGAGRVTLPLARRARLVYAMDPTPPLLALLERKLVHAHLRNVELLRGVFSAVPLPDDSVDAAVACSAFGTREARGGECGLTELRRVTRSGGRIVIMWPEDPEWFIARGFAYLILPGDLTITFPTLEDARQVAARFYGPEAMRYLDTTGRPELPFHILGVKAPRDVCWLTVSK